MQMNESRQEGGCEDGGGFGRLPKHSCRATLAARTLHVESSRDGDGRVSRVALTRDDGGRR